MQAAQKGIRLIITVDSGVRAHDVVEYARTLGIDVIVTDHHLPDATLPPAIAVVNHNRSDCGYPNKHLCGAGVALKLIQALLQRSSGPLHRQERFLSSLLKPVSIATIADVVPLLGENRTLVARGLAALQNIRNPGLSALFSVAGITAGQIPSSEQIAFRIAPRINAAGRMESARAVTDLLLTEDSPRARALALQLDRWNTDRRQIERAMVDNLISSLDPQQTEDGYVFWIRESHPGVIGIVASRLVERLGRPVIVLTDDPKEAGVLTGSGRSIPGFHLLEALGSMAEIFIGFGGHSQAAGLRLTHSEFDEFRSRFADYAFQRRKDLCRNRICAVDAEVQFSDLTLDFVRELDRLQPFGCGNPFQYCSRAASVFQGPYAP